jgi:[acyl-carrier-protein] S-malonyltransferase
MIAILFPGQGSQIVGMGSEFYNEFDIVKEIFEEANNILKFDIKKIILEGPQSELNLTKYTQPAIFTVSYSIFTVLKKKFNFKMDNVKYFAGHSLGEYSALVCSNSITFQDALHLLHERGKAMQEAVPLGQGGMLAILGIDVEELEKNIKKIKIEEACEIANDNADGQIIVSGDIKSINSLKDILKNEKIKSIMLPVSAPFHCSLMKSASEIMSSKLEKVIFKKPEYKIISNVTSEPENDPNKIKDLLIQQIYTKVRWRESILNMIKNDVHNFIEIGPGKVLSGLIKRIDRKCNYFNINSINNIKDINNEFKK